MDEITSEGWPNDAVLYQPYEVEQILLHEAASCLAVKAYLKMCKLPVEVRACANAEYMSPGGRMSKLPYLRAGAFNVAEFEPIVKFVEQKGSGIGQGLDEDEKADMRAYVSLVENIFSLAELYIYFLDLCVYNEVTVHRIGFVYPWPLKKLQNYRKRHNALRLLKVYQWNDMTMDDVIGKVEKCCDTLEIKLKTSGHSYFYGAEPCELDAIVFGHMFAILTTTLSNTTLAATVRKYNNLVAFCKYIERTYYDRQEK